MRLPANQISYRQIEPVSARRIDLCGRLVGLNDPGHGMPVAKFIQTDRVNYQGRMLPP